MSWSLLNIMLAGKVESLLTDKNVRQNVKDDERALTKAQAENLIHAVLWAYSSRAGSTASAYAMRNLFDTLGLETWTFKPQEEAPKMNIDSLRDCAVLDGQRLEALWADRDRLRAAYEFVLPYLHVDIRAQALAIYEPEPTTLEKYIGEFGSRDQP